MQPYEIAEKLELFVNAYFMAKTFADIKREEVDNVKREILNTAHYHANPELFDKGRCPERITEPRQDYMLRDDEWDDYFAALKWELGKRKIRPDDMDKELCPALIAESTCRDAERLLINEAWRLMGFESKEKDPSLKLWGDKRKEFIDLVCGMVVNRDGYKEPKL
jgi:hypothetical protein